jgi:hypothetical protein
MFQWYDQDYSNRIDPAWDRGHPAGTDEGRDISRSYDVDTTIYVHFEPTSRRRYNGFGTNITNAKFRKTGSP